MESQFGFWFSVIYLKLVYWYSLLQKWFASKKRKWFHIPDHHVEERRTQKRKLQWRRWKPRRIWRRFWTHIKTSRYIFQTPELSGWITQNWTMPRKVQLIQNSSDSNHICKNVNTNKTAEISISITLSNVHKTLNKIWISTL